MSERTPTIADPLGERAAMYAALGDPGRLAIVDELAATDRSPKELGGILGIPSNLMAHHLDVLEEAGLIVRFASAGDGRRKYVRLVREPLRLLRIAGRTPAGPMFFICRHNSARSQLAAALWTARTGRPADSAGTHPAKRVHRGAVAAARRAGLSLDGAVPCALDAIPSGAQVVTVCDVVHEEVVPEPDWWHWSIPDPVARGTTDAFDEVVTLLDARIATLMHDNDEGTATS